MLYFVDFDGTLIPDIKFFDENQFFTDTLKAKPLLSPEDPIFIDKNSQWMILTDRPECDLIYISGWCGCNGFGSPRIISSYGPQFTIPSTQTKIIMRKACLMFLNSWNYIDNTLIDCAYIDSDNWLERKINDTYMELKLLNKSVSKCVE